MAYTGSFCVVELFVWGLLSNWCDLTRVTAQLLPESGSNKQERHAHTNDTPQRAPHAAPIVGTTVTLT